MGDVRGSDLRRQLAGISMIVAPLLLLIADAMQISRDLAFEWPLVMWLSFLAFVPAVLGLSHLLRPRSDALGLLAAACCTVGLMAGSGMMTLFRLMALARSGVEGVPVDAVTTLLGSSAAFRVAVFLPGPLFPLGMLLFGIGLFRARIVPRGVAALVALGGPLFPIGHAIGIAGVALVGDAIWLLSLGWLGLRVLTRPAASWQGGVGYRSGGAAAGLESGTA